MIRSTFSMVLEIDDILPYLLTADNQKCDIKIFPRDSNIRSGATTVYLSDRDELRVVFEL
jgi:hypothetical protein